MKRLFWRREGHPSVAGSSAFRRITSACQHINCTQYTLPWEIAPGLRARELYVFKN